MGNWLKYLQVIYRQSPRPVHLSGIGYGRKSARLFQSIHRQKFCTSPAASNSIHFNQRFIHTTLPYEKQIVQFKLSDIGEGIQEVTVKEWFVKVGDKVSQFDQICEVQSDKASVTITSRYDGIITKVYYEVDEIALVGQPLIDVEVGETSSAQDEQLQVQEGDAIQVGRSEESVVLPTNDGNAQSANILATPAVRRIAAEHKIDLRDVKGTGKDGRVMKEDILSYISAKEGKQSQAAAPIKLAAIQPSATPSTDPKKVAPMPINLTAQDKKEPFKGFTRAMIKTMTAANSIPHFGYSDEIDVSELIRLRKDLKKVAEEYGIKLTYMPFFIKAASLALLQYPILNSSIDLSSDSIIYKGSHNIGVAMDTKLGLIVPNVKNVQNHSVLGVASELQRLHQSGQQGALKSEDLSGGTFTLSNIGSIGGTYAKPVILPPEVVIGALGKVLVLPRFDSSGNVIRASIVNASFSADHRVIDGATMSRFSNLWKSYLENPSSMLLHLK